MTVSAYKPKQVYNNEISTWINKWMSKIELQYPVIFDTEINKIMKDATSNAFTSKHHRRFLALLTKNMRRQDNVELFEKLYHPSFGMRKAAISYISKNYRNFKQRDQEFVRNVFVDRLHDDSPEVVLQVLKQSKKILSELFGDVHLKEVLFDLLRRICNDKREWGGISGYILSILCNMEVDDDVEMFLNVLPFLLPTDEKELEVSKIITSSKYSKKCKFLKKLEPVFNSNDCHTFAGAVYNSLCECHDIFTVETLISALKKISPGKMNVPGKYLATLLLCGVLPMECCFHILSSVLDIVSIYLQTCQFKIMKNDLFDKTYVETILTNKIPLEGYTRCLETLISKSKKPIISPDMIDFSLGNESKQFIVSLLAILLDGCYNNDQEISALYAKVFKHFLDQFCADFKMKINFLLNVSVTNTNCVFQFRCVRTMCSLLLKNSKNLQSLVCLGELFVPYVFVSLANPEKEIRSCLVNCLESIVSKLKHENNNYVELLESLVEHKDNIELDDKQAYVVIANVLDDFGDKKGKRYKPTLLDVIDSNCPIYVKSCVTDILSQLKDLKIHEKLSHLALTILQNNHGHELNNHECCIINNTITRFDSDLSSQLDLKSNLCKLLNFAITDDSVTIKHDGVESVLTVLAMNHIDKETFDYFKEDVKISLLDAVIDIATRTQIPEVSITAGHLFKHVNLASGLLVHHLKAMCEVVSPKVKTTPRKRRASVIPTPDVLETIEWRRGITIFEFLQNKKKIADTVSILPILFDILKKCLDFDEQAVVEYPKQLILSTIFNFCNKIEEDVPENVINMELIVQCIRASSNPQTHHHALLVLAHVAKMAPTQALHNIMAIFTFMGSSVLRHDDAYSFQIINKIIDTIIPILVESGRSCEKVVSVFKVFVGAILDVPEHRRKPLYENLITKIGAMDNLYIFLLLMLESHVFHSNTDKQQNKSQPDLSTSTTKRLDIALELCKEFPLNVVIANCTKIIFHLKCLPEEKEDVQEDDQKLLFDLEHHTPKQFRHYKYTILVFIRNLLSSREFVDWLAGTSDEDLIAMEALYKDLIINILIYIQVTAKVSARNLNTPQAQYWKVMLHQSYDVLDCMTALLTPSMFVLVVRGLATHSLKAIRRRALELLNTKLQHSSTFFAGVSEEEICTIIPTITTIIQRIDLNDDIDVEEEIIIQTALLSLKLLIKLLARDTPDKFIKILQFVTILICSHKVRGNVLASTILCLAELCGNLRAHCIPYLNKFIPVIIKILKSKETSELLLLSTLTALQKIVENLFMFLSPYLEKILCQLSIAASKWCSNSDGQNPTSVALKIGTIKENLGSKVPARILIPAINKSYNSVVGKNKFNSVEPLMDVLKQRLSNLTKSDVEENLSDLVEFFLNGLQFRANHVSSFVESSKVETCVIETFIVLVMKLSESAFRPLYSQMYESAVEATGYTAKIITFYAFSSNVAKNLKGLYVLFAGSLVNNIADILNLCNTVKIEQLLFEEVEWNVLLLEHVLSTLHSICLYDTYKFINSKERFDVLMQPLVDQLENDLGGAAASKVRTRELLIPCIVQFVVATCDDSLWKQLNYQVLLKMRNSTPEVRLMALDTLCEIVKKMGNDFLPLLAETVPFLAELFEDEDEDVENACKKSVQEMEKILGESLQKYF